MIELQKTIKTNKFLIKKFIKDIIFDFQHYDWCFQHEYKSSSPLLNRDESVIFLLDYIMVNYYMNNIDINYVETANKELKTILLSPLARFRGCQHLTHPLWFINDEQI